MLRTGLRHTAVNRIIQTVDIFYKKSIHIAQFTRAVCIILLLRRNLLVNELINNLDALPGTLIHAPVGTLCRHPQMSKGLFGGSK